MSEERSFVEEMISPLDLELDTNNFRFAGNVRSLTTEDSIISYLVKYQDVIGLAHQISHFQGLIPTERILVYKNKSGKHVVLEGNRRVCACKLLLKKGHYETLYDNIPEIDVETRSSLEKVAVLVASSKDVGEPIVAYQHVVALKKGWSDLNCMSFVTSRVKDGKSYAQIAHELKMTSREVEKSARGYKLCQRAIDQINDPEAQMSLWMNDDIDFSFFIDLILSKTFEKHFAAPVFNEAGNLNLLELPTLNNDLLKLAELILVSQLPNRERIDVLRLGKIGLLHRYFPTIESNLPLLNNVKETNRSDVQVSTFSHSSEGFPTSSNNNDNVQSQASGSETHYDERRTPIRTQKFFEFFEYRGKDARLAQLAKELRDINWKKYKISASFLMRALLEWVFVSSFEKAQLGNKALDPLGKKPGLEKILDVARRHSQKLQLDEKCLTKIEKISDNWLDDLNCNVHNDFGNSSENRLQDIASDIRPLAERLILQWNL
ncbi:hypothetical protein RYZ26_06675 [Terasakiella sp. A23]|uniref:hypothetical protein n=1 Tax=Terasakiella sp. FCG-A23 TaxID=3080561 RepID=UPI002955653C|nr:hypothetical protein [Terasakiella sp. A23]MDV7339270.1 hypothetical protein [Terasakiella sp. A23]